MIETVLGSLASGLPKLLGHFVAAGRVPPASAKFLARRPAAEWEVVRERFRERSPTPVAVEPLPRRLRTPLHTATSTSTGQLTRAGPVTRSQKVTEGP